MDRFTYTGIPKNTDEAVTRLNEALADCLPFQIPEAEENQTLIDTIMNECSDLLRTTQSMVNFMDNEKKQMESEVIVQVLTLPKGDTPQTAIKEEQFKTGLLKAELIHLLDAKGLEDGARNRIANILEKV